MKKFVIHYPKAVLIAIWCLLANVAYASHSPIGWALTLAFFFYTPGMLLLRLLKLPRAFSPYKHIFAVGVSLLFLMLTGLVVNQLTALGIQRPLSTINIFAALDALFLILFSMNIKDLRKEKIGIKLKKVTLTLEEGSVFTLTLILPILAILGAFRLNNGGTPILTLLLFALIPSLFFWLYVRPRLDRLAIPVIFSSTLSILLSLSLRGPALTGHDIQSEYYVFQLTFQHQHWAISNFRDPYNACLSITILPTIIAKITTISSLYVYKVVYQLVFALVILPTYFFMNRVSTYRTALIGSLVFISLPTFLNEMPFLNRQEVALLFFALLILLSYLHIDRKPKTILTILLLSGLVLSHYSSSYVTLGILGLGWIFYRIITKLSAPSQDASSILPMLSIPIILVALLFTFLWNSQITTTTAGLRRTITQTVNGLIDHTSEKAIDVSYTLFAPPLQSPAAMLARYAGDKANQVEYISPPNLNISKFGKLISPIVSPDTMNAILRAISAKILQIFLLIGTIAMLVKRRKKMSQQEAYFYALTLAIITLLVLQTMLPQLSVDYGTQRFFQQAVIILGVPIVFAVELLAGFTGKLKIFIIPFLFGVLFLDLSGFIPQITGGYPPQLSLNNSGLDYFDYYIRNSELNAANWLLNNHKKGDPIDMDRYAKLRFTSALDSNKLIADPLTGYNPNAYIYQDYGNMHSGTYQTVIDGTRVNYRLTINLGDEKNVIYNDGGGEVLR